MHDDEAVVVFVILLNDACHVLLVVQVDARGIDQGVELVHLEADPRVEGAHRRDEGVGIAPLRQADLLVVESAAALQTLG